MKKRTADIIISYIGALMFVCGLIKTILKYILLYSNVGTDKYNTSFLSVVLGAYLVWRFYKPILEK